MNGWETGVGGRVEGEPWLSGVFRAGASFMTPSVCELRRRLIVGERRDSDAGIIVAIGDLRVVIAAGLMNKSREHSRLGFAGLALLGYAGLAYLAFLLSFAWMIAFVVGSGLPRDVDGPVRDPAGVAVAIDLALIAVFAVQHTIMARPHFKQRLARVLPPAAERATFVLASALAVMLLCWQWRPIAGVVWQIDLAPVRIAVLGLSLIAWIGAGLTTFIHDHFEFFGLRTAWDHARGLSTSSSPLREVSAYRFVRHPMMALLLVALWATPTMTLGHLVFVVGLTIYVAIGVRFEERGLRRAFGDGYADYQRRVPMLIPRLFGQPGARE